MLKRKFFAWALMVLSCSLPFYSCGTDSTEDALNQQKNVQRETAEQLKSEYGKVAGDYDAGPAESSSTNGADADMAQVDVRVSGTLEIVMVPNGTSVPQPTIRADLIKKEKVATDDIDQVAVEWRLGRMGNAALPQPAGASDSQGTQDVATEYQATGGVYDPNTHDLALTVAGITAQGANISCREELPRLRCTWSPLGVGSKFTFTMIKKS